MFKPLGSFDVFKSGEDLWVFLGSSSSFLFKKINWKLKFLLCLPGKEPSRDLLISINKQFLCRNMLYLTRQDILLCHSYWNKLKKPSLKLFLFEKKIQALHQQWPKQDLSHTLSYFALPSHPDSG